VKFGSSGHVSFSSGVEDYVAIVVFEVGFWEEMGLVTLFSCSAYRFIFLWKPI